MEANALHNELVRMQRSLSHSQAEYIDAARRMIYLVKAVDLTFEPLYQGRALQRAIWRYEALWLPLLAAIHNNPTNTPPPVLNWAQHSFASKVEEIGAKNFAKGGLWLDQQRIVPPLDIAWVWHCHRLNPEAYIRDLGMFANENHQPTMQFMREACMTIFATAFKFSDGEDAQSQDTRRLWDIVYPFESFMPKYLLSHTYDEEQSKKRQYITSYTNEMNRASFRSVLQHDLKRAAFLQKAFLYQLVDEQDPTNAELFETNAYLNRAFQRYLQFIALHKQAPNVLLVPMNDINIMWHTHLSCTTEYTHDCQVLIGRIVPHDSISVDEKRQAEVAAMDEENAANGDILNLNTDTMEEEELADMLEKRRRGIAIKETKILWESCFGSKPRYDLPDTRYRGDPSGERGGFYEMFEKVNGTTRDIPWSHTLVLMLLSIVVFVFGMVVLGWAFVKTMLEHGRYLLGLPVGVGIMGLGVYIFLAIPISRPLSSNSRYWLERSYKQTHDPLPPYLISTSRKSQ